MLQDDDPGRVSDNASTLVLGAASPASSASESSESLACVPAKRPTPTTPQCPTKKQKTDMEASSGSAGPVCLVGPNWEYLTEPVELDNDEMFCACRKHRDMTFVEVHAVFEEVFEHLLEKWEEMARFLERLGITCVDFEEFFRREMSKLGWTPHPLPDLEMFHLPPAPLDDCDSPTHFEYDEYINEFGRISSDAIHNL